jgi:DNA uptake protein and related DNA-binding proteins
MNDFSVDERKVIIFIVSVLALGLGVRHIRTQMPGTAELFASIAPAEFLTDDVPAKTGSQTATAVIAINRADDRQLQSIPGIGPVIARRIIDYRGRNGPFHNEEELLKVKGIGPKKLQKMQNHISFE